jgi:hypothetical protein
VAVCVRDKSKTNPPQSFMLPRNTQINEKVRSRGDHKSPPQRHRDTEGTVFCRAGRRRPGKTSPEGRTFRGGVLLASRSLLLAFFQSRDTEAQSGLFFARPGDGGRAKSALGADLVFTILERSRKWRVRGGYRPALLVLCILLNRFGPRVSPFPAS